jgi:predicted transcriptional regulator
MAFFQFEPDPPIWCSRVFMFSEVLEMTGLSPLKMARLQIGKSQWHVAIETGISQSLISLYERGLREPKTKEKKVLAKLYGKKLTELWQ